MRDTHFIGNLNNAQSALRAAHQHPIIPPMKTGDKIRQIRKDKAMTLAEVEHRANLSNGNLSRIERGLQWVSEAKLREIAAALEVSVADLVADDAGASSGLGVATGGTGYGVVSSTSFVGRIAEAIASPYKAARRATDEEVQAAITKGKLPLISWVQAGEWSEIVDNFQPGDADEWIPCPFNHTDSAFILQVVGWSMHNPGGEKSYSPGEFIAVDPGREPRHKSMVIAKVDGDEKATFKQLLIDPEGSMMLKALNPDHRPNLMEFPADSRIVGVVIGKWTPE